MEILRERELRESIEKQLMEDQRNRGKSIHWQVPLIRKPPENKKPIDKK